MCARLIHDYSEPNRTIFCHLPTPEFLSGHSLICHQPDIWTVNMTQVFAPVFFFFFFFFFIVIRTQESEKKSRG